MKVSVSEAERSAIEKDIKKIKTQEDLNCQKMYDQIFNIPVPKKVIVDLVEGALLKCRSGESKGKALIVTSVGSVVTGSSKANESDCKPIINIPSFGLCKNKGVDCMPIIVGDKWMNTMTEKGTDERPTITTDSFLVCALGGLIEPVNSGQGFASPASSHIKKLLDKELKDNNDYQIFKKSCFTYKDDKGNVYTEVWDISNEMFTNGTALTQQQITDICAANNPGLIEREFDKAIGKLCKESGLNPAVILSTLQWEQGWCKKGNYEKAFGVGPAGSPRKYLPEEYGGLQVAIDTYLEHYHNGLKLESENGVDYSETWNQDVNFADNGGGGSTKTYGDENKDSKDYFINGQKVNVVNAAMYARLKYNNWLYYPPGNSHTTSIWQKTFLEMNAFGDKK